MRRTALILLALGTASALPVVELQKDVYEVALKEVGTPWLIEIYSGMCASCKAYADIWHGVEAKVLQNTKVAVGRIPLVSGGVGRGPQGGDDGAEAVREAVDAAREPQKLAVELEEVVLRRRRGRRRRDGRRGRARGRDVG